MQETEQKYGQLEQLSNMMLTFAYHRQNIDGPAGYTVRSSDRSRTNRTHCRLSPELEEWVMFQMENTVYNSKELFLGACVAFAATHTDIFADYLAKAEHGPKLHGDDFDVQSLELTEELLYDEPNKPDELYTDSTQDNGSGTTDDTPTPSSGSTAGTNSSDNVSAHGTNNGESIPDGTNQNENVEPAEQDNDDSTLDGPDVPIEELENNTEEL